MTQTRGGGGGRGDGDLDSEPVRREHPVSVEHEPLGSDLAQAGVDAGVDLSHDSRYLVVLAAEGEDALLDQYARLVDRKGLRGVLVREPDLDSYTAIAVEHAAGRFLSALPLAMKEVMV